MDGNGSRNRRIRRLVCNLKGFAFIAPSFGVLLIFTIFPLVFSLMLSFTDWDFFKGFNGIRFIGLQNFYRMPGDIWFTDSIRNNIYYTIVFVPLTLVLSLFFAILLNDHVVGNKIFRLLFFIPYISNIATVSILWTILYMPYGPIANFIKLFGIVPPSFLADRYFAMPAIILMSVWMNIGYCIMVYIAGLQGIPGEMFEAAEIDGANFWQRIRIITIPMLSPTTFFLLIIQIINSFKVFGPIQLMTKGGPVRATSVIVYYIYKKAFQDFELGYSSAMSLVLFVIIMVITIFQWNGQKKWSNLD